MSVTTELGKVSVTPKGEWSNSTPYAILDIVYYNGCSYLAKTTVPGGTAVTNTTYWMKIADKGDPGTEITEAVSGSTPSITAEANHRYICGECSTLSLTPCSEGTCEVVFESGSTATVLTVVGDVVFPDWFDATDLEANRLYNIIVTDGTYGAVISYTAE